MANNETIAKVAAVLSTLVEMKKDFVPASSVYMALGWDMMQYTSLVRVMSENGWVRATPSTIALTESGRVLGVRINERLQKSEDENGK